MNFTPTEIILLIGILVCFIFYTALGIRYATIKAIYQETLKHNKTLYDLYCQGHNSNIGLLNTLNQTLDYQKTLEKRNYDLSIENLQYKFRDDPKSM